jgi:hypothetical protein
LRGINVLPSLLSYLKCIKRGLVPESTFRYLHIITSLGMRQKKAEDAEPTKEFVIQLAQLWVVAQCRCVPTKMYHSESHLDCFSVDPWLVDEFKNCAEKFSKKLTQPE